MVIIAQYTVIFQCPQELDLGPATDTKIHLCSSPIVSTLQLQVLQMQIQPTIDCKHIYMIVYVAKKNLCISGTMQFKPMFFRGELCANIKSLCGIT